MLKSAEFWGKVKQINSSHFWIKLFVRQYLRMLKIRPRSVISSKAASWYLPGLSAVGYIVRWFVPFSSNPVGSTVLRHLGGEVSSVEETKLADDP